MTFWRFSILNLPNSHILYCKSCLFTHHHSQEHDIAPIIINDKMKYIPWGGDNQMPYKISALTILQYINFINNKPIGRIKYALN